MPIDIPRIIRALTGQPEPVTTEDTIQPIGALTIEQVAIILNNKLNELGSPGDIFIPDEHCKIYRKADVMAFHGLNEVSSIPYVGETHDCDDFAAKLFGKFAGLVWTNAHALNFFIDENSVFWFIEPQQGQLSQSLADWQGNQIRFLLGR